MKNETQTEQQSLQNAANSLGLTIIKDFQCDKRRTINKYYAVLSTGELKSVSPKVNYDKMNHFLLGWRNCMINNNH